MGLPVVASAVSSTPSAFLAGGGRRALKRTKTNPTRIAAKSQRGPSGAVVAVAKPQGKRETAPVDAIGRREAAVSGAALALSALVAGPAVGVTCRENPNINKN